MDSLLVPRRRNHKKLLFTLFCCIKSARRMRRQLRLALCRRPYDPILIEQLERFAAVDTFVYGATALRDLSRDLNDRLRSDHHDSRRFALQVLAWLPSSLLANIKLVYLPKVVERSLQEEPQESEVVLPVLVQLIPRLKDPELLQALLVVAKKLVKTDKPVFVQQAGLQLFQRLLPHCFEWAEPMPWLIAMRSQLSVDSPTHMLLVYKAIAQLVPLLAREADVDVSETKSTRCKQLVEEVLCKLVLKKYWPEKADMSDIKRPIILLLHSIELATSSIKKEPSPQRKKRKRSDVLLPRRLLAGSHVIEIDWYAMLRANQPQALIRLQDGLAAGALSTRTIRELANKFKVQLKTKPVIDQIICQAILLLVAYMRENNLLVDMLTAVADRLESTAPDSRSTWLRVLSAIVTQLAGTAALNRVCDQLIEKEDKSVTDYQLLALFIPHLNDALRRQNITNELVTAASVGPALLALWQVLMPQAADVVPAHEQSPSPQLALPAWQGAAEHAWLETVMRVTGYDATQHALPVPYCEAASDCTTPIPVARLIERAQPAREIDALAPTVS